MALSNRMLPFYCPNCQEDFKTFHSLNEHKEICDVVVVKE